ncbi:unnamed protein product, partial [Durusdinium trenchii]
DDEDEGGKNSKLGESSKGGGKNDVNQEDDTYPNKAQALKEAKFAKTTKLGKGQWGRRAADDNLK